MIDRLPVVQEGFLAIDHSLGSNPKKSIDDVRYLLFSPHDHHDAGDDPMGIRKIPDEIMAQLNLDSGLLKDYLESERDKGIDPLSRAILSKVPGGLLVNSQLNRGIVNLNQEIGQKGVVPSIWTPKVSREVATHLRAIHGAQLNAYAQIVAALNEGVPILHMHSMDNSGPKKGARPALSRADFRAYVEAQGLPAEQRNPRLNDFITGMQDGPMLADSKLYSALQTLFDRNGIGWAVNAPHDTELGYPDYTDMVSRPNRVSAIDLRKGELCKAIGSTFDSRTAEVDPVRVEFMAELFAQALRSRGI